MKILDIILEFLMLKGDEAVGKTGKFLLVSFYIFFLIMVIFFKDKIKLKNTNKTINNKDVAGFIACHTTYSLLNNIALKNTCFNKLKGK